MEHAPRRHLSSGSLKRSKESRTRLAKSSLLVYTVAVLTTRHRLPAAAAAAVRSSYHFCLRGQIHHGRQNESRHPCSKPKNEDIKTTLRSSKVAVRGIVRLPTKVLRFGSRACYSASVWEKIASWMTRHASGANSKMSGGLYLRNYFGAEDALSDSEMFED